MKLCASWRFSLLLAVRDVFGDVLHIDKAVYAAWMDAWGACVLETSAQSILGSRYSFSEVWVIDTIGTLIYEAGW